MSSAKFPQFFCMQVNMKSKLTLLISVMRVSGPVVNDSFGRLFQRQQWFLFVSLNQNELIRSDND